MLQGNLLHFTLILVNAFTNVDLKYLIKMKNIECFPDKEWFDISCTLKAVNRTTTLVNIDSVLKQDVTSGLMHVQTFKRYNTYQPFLVNVTFPLCSFISKRQRYFFSTFALGFLKKYTNINHTCPYYKGSKLFAKDLYYNPFDHFDFSIGSIAAGRYRTDVSFYPNGLTTRAVILMGHSDINET